MSTATTYKASSLAAVLMAFAAHFGHMVSHALAGTSEPSRCLYQTASPRRNITLTALGLELVSAYATTKFCGKIRELLQLQQIKCFYDPTNFM